MKFRTNIFIVTKQVPERNKGLITDGRLYRVYGVINPNYEVVYGIMSDLGQRLTVNFKNCALLNGGTWDIYTKYEKRRSGDRG